VKTLLNLADTIGLEGNVIDRFPTAVDKCERQQDEHYKACDLGQCNCCHCCDSGYAVEREKPSA